MDVPESGGEVAAMLVDDKGVIAVQNMNAWECGFGARTIYAVHRASLLPAMSRPRIS